MWYGVRMGSGIQIFERTSNRRPTRKEIANVALESISAKITDGPTVTVDFDLDETLKEAVDRYGEAIVFSRYRASLVIDLQAYMRIMIKAKKTNDEIQAAVSEWKPGVKAKGRSPAERARDLFQKLSPEERRALLEEFEAA